LINYFNALALMIQQELDILKKYLQESILSDFNKKNLSSELATAKVVAEEDLPNDGIRLNAVVNVREVKTKQSFIFQIVLPAAADFKKNKVSVFAPIAIALMGYRKGATTKWEMPGGIQEFVVMEVTRVGIERVV
jgi:regulator of nucleoside diphosphate kinase